LGNTSLSSSALVSIIQAAGDHPSLKRLMISGNDVNTVVTEEVKNLLNKKGSFFEIDVEIPKE
jgi:hypothetical protein